MSITIEAGKCYTSVDGRVFGPMKPYYFGERGHGFTDSDGTGGWFADGKPTGSPNFWPVLVAEVPADIAPINVATEPSVATEAARGGLYDDTKPEPSRLTNDPNARRLAIIALKVLIGSESQFPDERHFEGLTDDPFERRLIGLACYWGNDLGDAAWSALGQTNPFGSANLDTFEAAQAEAYRRVEALAVPAKPDLHDMRTHRQAWRKGIEEALSSATRENEAYWKHELEAFDRAFAEFDRAFPQPVGFAAPTTVTTIKA